MVDTLVGTPLLAVMLVLAAGAAVGQVKFGPLRFGAAGALFVGLVVGSLDAGIGATLGVLQTLGLALFVYTVGLTAGSTFLRDLRKQWPLMLVAIGVIVLVAVVVVIVGRLAGLTGPALAGAFSGALTSTPALAAAQFAAQGDPLVAVGYALAYPVGVILAIIAAALTIGRNWPGHRDTPSLAGQGLTTLSVVVEHPMTLLDLPGWNGQHLKASYLRRGGTTRVVRPDEPLEVDDILLLVGPKQVVAEACSVVGRPAETALTHSRHDVDFRRFLVSNRRLTGVTVAELDLPGELNGVVTRVRRGDLDMVAADDLALQPGDRVLAVVPRRRMDEAAAFFGDSERQISEIDSFGFAIGLGLGLLVGLISVPLPTGESFSPGTAAGPLVVGMILGALHRTGLVQWDLPQAANLTIRQLGLLLFLAAVGLKSGPAFAEAMFSWTGVKLGILAALILALVAVLFFIGGWMLSLSTPRIVGAFAGLIGQPAILSFVTTKTNDERVESGYAAVFALTMIVKIAIVPFMAAS